MFVSRFGDDGNFHWARNWGGGQFDWGEDIAIDGNGAVYVVGWYKVTADFDPGPGVEEHTSNGYEDAYLMKIMPDGYWWE